MRVLTGAIVALALVGSAGAHAQQVYLAELAAVYGNLGPYYAAAPVVVAPGYVAPDYVCLRPSALHWLYGRRELSHGKIVHD